MASEDREDEAVVRQAHDALCRSDNRVARLNTFDLCIETYLRRDVTYRIHAGAVLLALVRLAATTGQWPGIIAGCRLAAHEKFRETRRSSPESLAREFSRGFSRYRNTAHLQAAAIHGSPGIAEIELSPADLTRFLARARGFEMFMDRNVHGPRQNWSPWRVPTAIRPETRIEVQRLGTEQLAWAGAGR